MTTPHPYMAVELGKFCWCLHCEKVFATAAWQANEWKCPSCGASAFDMWDWQHVRTFNPSYPEVPEEGTYFAMYPSKEEGQANG